MARYVLPLYIPSRSRPFMARKWDEFFQSMSSRLWEWQWQYIFLKKSLEERQAILKTKNLDVSNWAICQSSSLGKKWTVFYMHKVGFKKKKSEIQSGISMSCPLPFSSFWSLPVSFAKELRMRFWKPRIWKGRQNETGRSLAELHAQHTVPFL